MNTGRLTVSAYLAKIAPSKPAIAVKQAISTAEGLLGGKYNDWPASLEYVLKPDNTAALTHVVQIQNDATGVWYEAFVDAHSNELVSVTDFVARATVSELFFLTHST
jgi:extracellular elastinolytic metalloproteinase